MLGLIFVGKPTTMKDEHESGDFPSSRAVDGIYYPPSLQLETISLAHSDTSYMPWWRVNLLDIHCVWGVLIFNRACKYV